MLYCIICYNTTLHNDFENTPGVTFGWDLLRLSQQNAANLQTNTWDPLSRRCLPCIFWPCGLCLWRCYVTQGALLHSCGVAMLLGGNLDVIISHIICKSLGAPEWFQHSPCNSWVAIEFEIQKNRRASWFWRLWGLRVAVKSWSDA
jgi:hypothetical protein